MATTANTSTTTPAVRGNHPAGRALPGNAGARRSGVPLDAPPAVLRLVQGGSDGVRVGGGVQERWADVVPLRPEAGAEEFRGGQRPAVPPSAVHPSPVPLRLTRRGRRVILGVVVAGGLCLAALAGPALSGEQSAESGLALAGESSVVVAPGDTLWSIASTIAPDTDPRAVVDALRSANELDGVALVPGQVLLVP